MTGPKFANDGYSKLLSEGTLRKGGQNSSSQIHTRPAAPAPMKPASNSGSSGNSGSTSSSSTKKP